VIGSNIYNVLGILGVTALVQPIPFPSDLGWLDWVALVGSAGLVTAHVALRGRITRLEGLLLMVLYGAYVAARLLLQGG
jgi:cation:H+ antiporter